MDEPAYVLQAIRECHRIYSEILYRDQIKERRDMEKLSKVKA